MLAAAEDTCHVCNNDLLVPQESYQAKPRPGLAIAGAAVGAFMAVLNIQITNASLPDIQGGSAPGSIRRLDLHRLSGRRDHRHSADRVPATVFSLRRYLLGNAVLFLVFSVACAFAQT